MDQKRETRLPIHISKWDDNEITCESTHTPVIHANVY